MCDEDQTNPWSAGLREKLRSINAPYASGLSSGGGGDQSCSLLFPLIQPQPPAGSVCFPVPPPQQVQPEAKGSHFSVAAPRPDRPCTPTQACTHLCQRPRVCNGASCECEHAECKFDQAGRGKTAPMSTQRGCSHGLRTLFGSYQVPTVLGPCVCRRVCSF